MTRNSKSPLGAQVSQCFGPCHSFRPPTRHSPPSSRKSSPPIAHWEPQLPRPQSHPNPDLGLPAQHVPLPRSCTGEVSVSSQCCYACLAYLLIMHEQPGQCPWWQVPFLFCLLPQKRPIYPGHPKPNLCKSVPSLAINKYLFNID